jgi:hypothetical protein
VICRAGGRTETGDASGDGGRRAPFAGKRPLEGFPMDHKLSNREIALGVATFLVALVVMALYG